jgi:hypothetical protein
MSRWAGALSCGRAQLSWCQTFNFTLKTHFINLSSTCT